MVLSFCRVYVCVCTRAPHMCSRARMWKPKAALSIFIGWFPLFFFGERSHMEHGTSPLTRMAGQWEPGFPSSAGIIGACHLAWLLCRAENPNAGPCAFILSALIHKAISPVPFHTYQLTNPHSCLSRLYSHMLSEGLKLRCIGWGF